MPTIAMYETPLGPSGQLCVGIRRQDNCSQFRVSGYPLLHLNVLCISIRVSDAELLPILEQLIVGGEFVQDLALDFAIVCN